MSDADHYDEEVTVTRFKDAIQLDEYFAYLDEHVDDDVQLMSSRQWLEYKGYIRHCYCGGTVVTSTNRCGICSSPAN